MSGAKTRAPAAGLAGLLRGLLGVWVVLLVLALYPYTADPASPVKNIITASVALLAALIWLAAMAFGGAGLRVSSPGLAMLGAFAAVQFIAALFATQRMLALDTIRAWGVLGLVALLAAQVYREDRQLWRWMAVAVLATSAAAVYGYLQRLGYDPFPWSTRNIEEYRGLPSTYANPNFAGHALVFGVIMTTGLALRAGARSRWQVRLLWIPALILTSGHLYLTHMRAARLALMGALFLVLGFALLRRLSARPVRLATALMVCFLVGAVALAGGLFERHGKSDNDAPLPVDASLVLRLNGYYGAAQMLLERPVLGFGPGNYQRENTPYWTEFEKQWFALEGRKNHHVHCGVMEMGIDAGVPGMAAYLGLLFAGILGGMALWLRPDRRLLGAVLAACFAGFAIDGLFGFNLRVPVSAGIFFLLFGAAQGIRMPKEASPGPSSFAMISMIALVLLAAGNLVFEAQSFRAEHAYQRGQGARVWASEFRRRGDEDRTRQTLGAAQAALQKARRIQPWEPRFHEAVGLAALEQQDYEAAASAFTKALVYAPHNPGIHVALADTRVNRAWLRLEAPDRAAFEQDLALAQNSAGRALRLCPPLAEAHAVLAHAFYLRALDAERCGETSTDAWQGVQAACNRALGGGADQRSVLFRLLAQAEHALNRVPAAEAAFRRSAATDPADPETWIRFRDFARREKRPHAYTDALSTALPRLRQQDPMPRSTLALAVRYLAESYQDQLDEAALAGPLLREALEWIPESAETWAAYAGLYPREDRLGRIKAVAAKQDAADLPLAVQALVNMDPNEPAGILPAARAVMQNAAALHGTGGGDGAHARAVLWAADLLLAKADATPLPDEVKARVLAQLGGVYAASAEWSLAERILAAALGSLPEQYRATPLQQRSEALAHLGRDGEALAAARAAIALAPSHPIVRWTLAKRLAAAGRIEEARVEYRSLLRGLRPNAAERASVQAELEALEARVADEGDVAP